MFGSRNSRGKSVTCIACGDSVSRSDAREYDKHGDRWDRQDKEFEHLCKACFADLCQQPRDGLETTLDAAGAGEADRETFLERFRELSESDAHGD
ncbi:hypothetical protein NDI54_03910 [Haloarcula sp. S1AR25-5A]|uniref:Small CPxCG-related zinc finger protein n=1 Tax=Haloarcula terrestris TaxID=2950533 RepID=A0AAE4EUS4_9EURY|nr:hypothetical protein [Haloarcula terrestris]MDS0220493.1 hypothetical protein [Haloarcula terrestris]